MKKANGVLKILRYASLFTVLIFGLITIVGTGDNGGGPKSSTISGDAAKGPISGGTIQLFYFDSNGDEVEIIADNDPVTTDAAGGYSFEIDPAILEGITSPLIVRIVGGTTDGQSAPQLEAVIADPSTLSAGGSSVTAHLSVASSVAAGLLTKLAATGVAPATADANDCITKVENELEVDLTEDPATAGTGVAEINELVDLNLDLPENNIAVDELIDYLVANLSSTSGALDNNMDDPANPGTDTAAAFSGDLDTVLPGGPSDFRILSVEADKTSVGNNGTDAATLTATLEDINGNAVADESIDLSEASGTIILSDAAPVTAANGEAQASLTSTAAAGTATVDASYTLANGNALSEQIIFTISDCQDVSAISVASDKTSIISDGADAATITATLSAVCTGSTVPDDTTVNFAVISGTGDLSAASSTTIDGQASVTLTGTQVSAVTVQASAIVTVGAAFTDTVDINIISDPCDPGEITVAADPTAIGTGGTSTITATVTPADPDTCATGIADGTTVTFSATGGGTVSPTQATTTSGVATTTLTAPSSVGTVAVTATVDSISDSVDVSVASLPSTTTVTVSLTGVAAGTTLMALDVVIDYDETKVTFNNAVSGSLTEGAGSLLLPNDHGDYVNVGGGNAYGFDGGASGSIMVLTFDVIQPNIPTAGDFPVTAFLATDLNGADAGLDSSNISMDIDNQ
ncbi:MAG: invasin domain 3-containing protein [Thermodesulfobacteriota bacterium]|nr:invasin domain 3-containing protein [Thermodesulfobacteriota bacterium]